ncbi:unnamed protein product [Rangifer tarandus platyrhynchus]|uniref:Uncharacterized protein n=2 Tax=Rangifer tarandus platyrhynchus TaxID=3082113 RepID=A0ABN8YXU2_RANTA|nr:unnamed protein product [Rangifer tarandus platyrhynchus]CAI9693679.1 unnamed protein product [Rangifer tarandus platyrhynchus]
MGSTLATSIAPWHAGQRGEEAVDAGQRGEGAAATQLSQAGSMASPPSSFNPGPRQELYGSTDWVQHDSGCVCGEGRRASGQEINERKPSHVQRRLRRRRGSTAMATGLSAALSEVVRPERLHVLGACRLRVIKSGELPGEPSSEKHLARIVDTPAQQRVTIGPRPPPSPAGDVTEQPRQSSRASSPPSTAQGRSERVATALAAASRDTHSTRGHTAPGAASVQGGTLPGNRRPGAGGRQLLLVILTPLPARPTMTIPTGLILSPEPLMPRCFLAFGQERRMFRSPTAPPTNQSLLLLQKGQRRGLQASGVDLCCRTTWGSRTVIFRVSGCLSPIPTAVQMLQAGDPHSGLGDPQACRNQSRRLTNVLPD